MKLYSVNTGYFRLDGGAMFGVVPKSIWNKLNPADDNNMQLGTALPFDRRWQPADTCR